MRTAWAHPWVGHMLLCTGYLPIAVALTWPLARYAATHVYDAATIPGAMGPVALADILLVVWALAWDTHALTHSPATLFDGNIFYPARWSLARSDHFLGNVPLFAAVYLPTGNPVLAHNLTWLASFVLSAWAMYALAWRWTERRGAAFVAGALFAFAPWRMLVAHVQTQSVMYLPLILLSGDHLLTHGRRRWACALAGLLVLQTLCSVYLGALAFTLAAATVVAHVVAGAPAAGSVRRALVAIAAAVVPLAAVHLPYALLARTGELEGSSRTVQELMLSASPVASYVRIRDFGTASYFLTLATTACAVVGVLVPPAGGRTARVVLIGTALVGYVLSLGPTARLGSIEIPLPYRLLAAVPGLGSLRGAGRFGILVAFAASGLAALGLATALARLGRRSGLVILAAVLAGQLAEVAAHRIPLRPLETGTAVPPVYRWLATQATDEPVLELPVGRASLDFQAFHTQARYTYFSSYHWRPLLNGYSGYPPASFYLMMTLARQLPDPGALQDLVDLSGVRWVVLHREALTAEEREGWAPAAALPGLSRVTTLGTDDVYRVTVPARRDLRDLVRDARRGPLTLGGTSRAPLPSDALHALLRNLELPRHVFAGLSTAARVTVENRSERTWPGLDPFPDGLVALDQEWLAATGAPPLRNVSPLGRDLVPRATVSVRFPLLPPHVPGSYRLRLTLAQDGGPSFAGTDGGSLEIPVEVLGWPGAPSGPPVVRSLRLP